MRSVVAPIALRAPQGGRVGAGGPGVGRRHPGGPFATHKPEGIGLGLYYVHSLTEAIGAELTLNDREFGGAVAKISIPIVPTANTAESSGPGKPIRTPDWRPQNG